jgi:hypothetical protein
MHHPGSRTPRWTDGDHRRTCRGGFTGNHLAVAGQAVILPACRSLRNTCSAQPAAHLAFRWPSSRGPIHLAPTHGRSTTTIAATSRSADRRDASERPRRPGRPGRSHWISSRPVPSRACRLRPTFQTSCHSSQPRLFPVGEERHVRRVTPPSRSCRGDIARESVALHSLASPYGCTCDTARQDQRVRSAPW